MTDKKSILVVAENVGSGYPSPTYTKERESPCLQEGDIESNTQAEAETKVRGRSLVVATFLVYIVP